MSRGRRFRRGYQKVSLILLAVFAAFVLVLYLALNGASSADTQPRGSANAGQAAPGAPADPNPVATAAPVQTAPAAPPSGLSPAQALDWRLVQWDKLTNNGQNEGFRTAQLNQSTGEWVATINDWIYHFPIGDGALAGQFGGLSWIADGVLANPGDPEFYPKLVNGVMMATQIGINGNSNDPPGSTVRFFYSALIPPGSAEGIQRTFKLVWHVSSDGVGHPLVSLCKGDVPRC
jgi:hypothetical protein